MRPFVPLACALAALASLAACSGPSRDAAPAHAAPAADGYVAKVAGLSAPLRAGVLLRAIRDGGQNCQQVIDGQPVAGAGVPSTWVATCEDHRRWVVAIADDGGATVADAKDVARQH